MLTAVEIEVIIDIGGTCMCQSRVIWQHKRHNRYVHKKSEWTMMNRHVFGHKWNGWLHRTVLKTILRSLIFLAL